MIPRVRAPFKQTGERTGGAATHISQIWSLGPRAKGLHPCTIHGSRASTAQCNTRASGVRQVRGLAGPRCSRLTTPSAAQPERKGMPFCCGGNAAPAWGYFFTLTAKRLAVHVLSNGLGAPLYWFGSALLGSISLKTHSMFPKVHAMCVCAAVSSFSKLFMFHLPKKGVSGRLLLQLGPKIHGPSETVGLCVTTDSFALLQNTMLFSERIIVNLTMMDSSHLPLLQPSAYRCTGGCCSHARRVRPCLGRGDR